MKFPEGWTLGHEDPLIVRAQEIVNDLILEYGIPIKVRLETSQYQVASMFEGMDTITFISAVHYCVGNHIFETIRELRRVLENKAFL